MSRSEDEIRRIGGSSVAPKPSRIGVSSPRESGDIDGEGHRGVAASGAVMLAHAGGAHQSLSMILVAGGVLMGWVGLDRTRGHTFQRVPRWAGLALVGLAPAVFAAAVVVLVWPSGIASGPRPASPARIAFTEPSSGQTVTGDLLDVRLRIDDATIVERSSTNITPDTGHIHLFLDGKLLSMTTGREQQVQVGQLSPGVHRLQAEFVAADHDPFRPRVVTTVIFVKEGA